jgi:hypothetical protein
VIDAQAPAREIYSTTLVKCSHGSTGGELDAETICSNLRARGVDEASLRARS